jgi:hypothetical protein
MTSAASGQLLAAARRSWVREFRTAASEIAPVWWVLGIYAFLMLPTAYLLDVSLVQSLAGYVLFALGLIEMSATLGALFLILRIALAERPHNPLQRFREEIARWAAPAVAARAILFLFALALLQMIYGFYKPLIPRFVPYSWDPLFSAADRIIFLGYQPWELLWPILGHAATIFLLNILYNLWFFWMLLVWVLVAFARRHREANNQYFLAEMFLWSVGGTAMAIVFAAAGPCYYGGFHPGPDPYHALMANLLAINDRVPVFSLTVQAMLWDGQLHPEAGKLAGISALPSLHVAAAVLRTRIAFVHSRPLGFACAAATFMIFLASIVLGWHYAVDGIVGTAVSLGFWHIAGRVMEWRRNRGLAAEAALAPS